MGKPAKKKAYWESKKAEEGRLAAQRKFNKNISLMDSIRDNAIKFLEKHPIDILLNGGLAYLGTQEIGGVGGALYGPVCLKLATSDTESAAIVGIAGLIALGACPWLKMPFTEGVKAFLDNINIRFTAAGETTTDKLEKVSDSWKPHVQDWFAAIMNGSVGVGPEDDYCPWYARKYPSEPVPAFCGGPIPPTVPPATGGGSGVG